MRHQRIRSGGVARDATPPATAATTATAPTTAAPTGRPATGARQYDRPYDRPYDRSYDYSHEGHDGQGDLREMWEARSRIVLLPTAAPSILGLFGFAGATMMVGAWEAGWYGTTTTGFALWPFCAMLGGIAQFTAAMWSYRARDGLATAMHGLWGSFWMAFGILFGLGSQHLLPITPFGSVNPAFAFWFVVLAVITLCGALAALAQNVGLAVVLWTLAAGSAFTAVGYFTGVNWLFTVAGWLFVVSAAAAVWTAAALMLKESFGRVILPLGEYSKDKNVPGRIPAYPIEYELGMPGAKVGQ